MKKKIAFIMSLVMCGSMFTACGSSDDSSSSKQSSTTSSASTEASSEEDTTEAEDEDKDDEDEEKTTENSIVKPTAADDEDEEEDTTSDSHKAAEGTDYERGVVENGVYHSDYADLTFETPDGWTELTEEQLLNMMNLGLELTGNEDMMNEELMKQSAIYDYSARDVNGGNIAIMYENLKVSMGSLADSMDEETYLTSVQKQLQGVSGVTYDDLTGPEEVELCGNTYYKISHKATYDIMGGYTVSQNYYVRKIDDFMLLILLTSGADGEDMDKYEQNFVD